MALTSCECGLFDSEYSQRTGCPAHSGEMTHILLCTAPFFLCHDTSPVHWHPIPHIPYSFHRTSRRRTWLNDCKLDSHRVLTAFDESLL